MTTKELEFAFPARAEPAWSPKVDRWYQLDAYAYGLAEAYEQWKGSLGGEKPSMIVLASPGASNETDRQFAQSGGTSPAKFVHTLPNVRSSSLCQVMGWAGPVLCLQRDPETLNHALTEAEALVGDEFPVVWVLSVGREASGRYRATGNFLRKGDSK